MTSAVQRSREALGLRLRQLRKDHEEGLTVRSFAERLGWPHSKVSKIETGRQTPSRSDLSAWCSALGRGDAAGELVRMLTSLESLYREYRHQLRTGARALQSALGDLETRTDTLRIVETAVIPGLLQTPDYARAMIAESIEFSCRSLRAGTCALADPSRRSQRQDRDRVSGRFFGVHRSDAG